MLYFGWLLCLLAKLPRCTCLLKADLEAQTLHNQEGDHIGALLEQGLGLVFMS